MGAPSSAWASFYEGREGHGYLQYVKERYAPFISAIASRLQFKDCVLELGAGTGTITKALVMRRDVGFSEARLCASDVDPAMVELAKERLAIEEEVSVFLKDALEPSEADVVHSHGMLEHFDDITIRSVIEAHRHARVQVHYVPGEYDEPTFGDERLMPVKAWWDICQPDQIITFNGGLDYALIFERN
jgi:trans-aconitate methyltransferase